LIRCIYWTRVQWIGCCHHLFGAIFDWQYDETAIDQSHHGFHFDDENIGVEDSFEQDKWRESFNNTEDICWHFHDHLEDWKVYPCL
jgi:hypothetical protein